MIDVPKIETSHDGLNRAFMEWRKALLWSAGLNANRGLARDMGSAGRVIHSHEPTEHWMRLSGATSPYSGTEVYASASGGWTTKPSGLTLTSLIYEANGISGLNNKVVRVFRDQGLYWCHYNRVGLTVCGTYCVTVLGCNSGGVGSGATVTLKLSGVTVASCTTGSDSKCCLDVPSAGSGYSLEITAPSGSNLANKTITGLSLTCGSSTRTVTLDPATGYSCYPCFSGPIPSSLTTVTLTDSVYGSTTTTVYYPGGGAPSGLCGDSPSITYFKLAGISYPGASSTKCGSGSPFTCSSGTLIDLYYSAPYCAPGVGYIDVCYGINSALVGSGVFPLECPSNPVTQYIRLRYSLTGISTSPYVLTFGGTPTQGCDHGIYPGGSPTITITYS